MLWVWYASKLLMVLVYVYVQIGIRVENLSMLSGQTSTRFYRLVLVFHVPSVRVVAVEKEGREMIQDTGMLRS